MAKVNEKPVLASKSNGEVVYDGQGGEKFTFLHLHEGGAYVVPNKIVYSKRDGRNAISYTVLQDVAVKLIKDMNVEQAIRELEARPTVGDPVLDAKLIEYGISLAEVTESKRSVYFVTDSGKKVRFVPNVAEIPDRGMPFQATADTDMTIVETNGEYYFLPPVCLTQGKKQGQFFFNKKLIYNIGPNHFYALKFLAGEEEKVNELYREKVKVRKGELKSPRKVERDVSAGIEAVVSKIESPIEKPKEKPKDMVEPLEELATNPQMKGFKEMTYSIDIDLDMSATYDKVVLEQKGQKVVLSSNELDQVKKLYEYVKQFLTPSKKPPEGGCMATNP